MAKRKIVCKLNAIKSAQKRVIKRDERRARTAKATEARWATKLTAPQPNTDAEMAQPSEEEPSTSEAPARDNDGQPSSTPTPVTPLEMDVPSVEMMGIGVSFPSTPADEDQQIQPMPSTSTARCDLVATPSTLKCAGAFGLDDETGEAHDDVECTARTRR